MRRILPIVFLGLALLAAGCEPAGQAVSQGGDQAAPQPSQVITNPDPYYALALPPTWRRGAAAGQTVLTASSITPGADLRIEARPLQRPLDLAKLGQALVRVEQKKLTQAGGAAMGPAQPAAVGGLDALVFDYQLQGAGHRRFLAPTAKYLYVIDVTAASPPAQAGLDQVLASLSLVPGMAPAGASVVAAGSVTADAIEAHLDSLDVPRLAAALSEIRAARRANPGDPALGAREAEAAALYALVLELENRPRPVMDWPALIDLARRGGDGPDAQRALGLALLAGGQPGDAEAALDRAAKAAPSDARTYLVRGLWYSFDPAQQAKLCQRALELRPGFIGAQFLLAKVKVKEGNQGDAMLLYQKILESDPGHTGALMGLARQDMDNPSSRDRAAERFRQVLAKDPVNTSARFNLAILLIEKKDYAGAGAQLDKLLEIDSSDAGAFVLRGQAQQAQGQDAQAKVSYEAATKADPKSAAAFFNLGAICASRLNDVACAKQAFARFIQLEPDSQRARKVRGWLGRH